VPEKGDSIFEGWYKEAALTNKVNFPYDINSVTDDITLYAKWTDVSIPVLLYTSTALPDGKEGQSYSANIGTAKFPEDAIPVTINYSVTAGSLPAGLTLSAAGLLSGTPAVGSAGTKTFTVQASANGCDNKSAVFTLLITAASADEPFVGGTGTPKTAWYTANPDASNFTINDADELAGLAQLVNGGNRFKNKTITLNTNLDLSVYGTGTTFNSGKGWIPIGIVPTGLYYVQGEPFLGIFNGNGKTITDLAINTGSSYQGLFGFIGYESEIKNLKLKNVEISGNYNIGGIAGYNSTFNGEKSGSVNEDSSGKVSNCSVTGSITGVDCIGGIIGDNNFEGFVESCFFSGNVSGNFAIGGIVGENNGRILGCRSAGNITGIEAAGREGNPTKAIGGIVGYSSGIIINCYTTGDITGGHGVGGIAGDHFGIMGNCYATGVITSMLGDFSCVGGIVGYVKHNDDIEIVRITNCTALNKNAVTHNAKISGHNLGRIVGEWYGAISTYVDNNYALNSMTVKYDWNGTTGTDKTLSKGLMTDDGADITPSGAEYTQSWWSGTVGFSFGNDVDHPWVMPAGSNTLPKLYWEEL